MRKSPILEAIFPSVRADLLAAVFAQPWREWYLSEIASFLKLRPSSMQREIDALTKAGILTQRRDGRRIYLKVDETSPVFPELKGFFDKTAGLLVVLEHVLEPLKNILLAFVYGSVARSAERSASDVDLLIVGNVDQAMLVTALREAEHRIGRPISITYYSPSDFKVSYLAGDHFLTNVLKGKIEFVRGGEYELDSLRSEA